MPRIRRGCKREGERSASKQPDAEADILLAILAAEAADELLGQAPGAAHPERDR